MCELQSEVNKRAIKNPHYYKIFLISIGIKNTISKAELAQLCDVLLQKVAQ